MLKSRALWFIRASAVLGCIGAGVFAQAPAAPTFEAASVKPNTSGSPRAGTQTMPGGRVVITNQTLRQMVRSAYGYDDIEVVGGPDWIGIDRWDVVAVAGTGDADARWRPRLKSLLIDRFMLQAHTEPRERPVFALVVSRSDRQLGPNIHPSKADIACQADQLCGNSGASGDSTVGAITGTAMSMTEITQGLTRYAGRRVLDRTGLKGRYDFELQWSDVPIFTALQEQLGLKLESTKGQV